MESQYYRELEHLGIDQRADAPDISEILGNATDIVEPQHDMERVVYKVWIEIERSIYSDDTGDEHGHVDMGFDLLSGAHVAEFMADSPSPLADDLARGAVTEYGEMVQDMARELAVQAEWKLRRQQEAAAASVSDGGGGA